MRAIESFEIELGDLNIMVSVVCFECFDGFIRYNQMSGSVELPALPDGVMWPSPVAMSERLLEWQRRGLQYTATGYGTKIPTSKVIAWSDGKVRRVYCDIYSNSGSCYCMIHGCKVSIEGFDLISGATK